MPAKMYKVELTGDEQAELEALTRKGKISARKMKRAQILMKAALGWRDAEIVRALAVSRTMVERTRKRFVEGGLARGLMKINAQARGENWTSELKCSLLLWRAVNVLITRRAGVCDCWLTSWWNWGWSRASLTKQCARY